MASFVTPVDRFLLLCLQSSDTQIESNTLSNSYKVSFFEQIAISISSIAIGFHRLIAVLMIGKLSKDKLRSHSRDGLLLEIN